MAGAGAMEVGRGGRFTSGGVAAGELHGGIGALGKHLAVTRCNVTTEGRRFVRGIGQAVSQRASNLEKTIGGVSKRYTMG